MRKKEQGSRKQSSKVSKVNGQLGKAPFREVSAGTTCSIWPH